MKHMRQTKSYAEWSHFSDILRHARTENLAAAFDKAGRRCAGPNYAREAPPALDLEFLGRALRTA